MFLPHYPEYESTNRFHPGNNQQLSNQQYKLVCRAVEVLEGMLLYLPWNHLVLAQELEKHMILMKKISKYHQWRSGIGNI
jgi:hypothetical protein